MRSKAYYLCEHRRLLHRLVCRLSAKRRYQGVEEDRRWHYLSSEGTTKGAPSVSVGINSYEFFKGRTLPLELPRLQRAPGSHMNGERV